MSVKILHNPRCSKSRATLALLEENGVQPEVELYQEQHYSADALRTIAEKLGVTDLRDMMRTKDELYRTLQLGEANQAQLLQALVDNPQLLERPIVICGDKARIGRPPENVLEIL